MLFFILFLFYALSFFFGQRLPLHAHVSMRVCVCVLCWRARFYCFSVSERSAFVQFGCLCICMVCVYFPCAFFCFLLFWHYYFGYESAFTSNPPSRCLLLYTFNTSATHDRIHIHGLAFIVNRSSCYDHLIRTVKKRICSR